MNAMGENPSENTDNATILLKYKNGSTGVINYFSNGSKSYSKERIEVYSQDRTAINDNFRRTTGYGFKGFSRLSTKLDKGHKNQFHQLIHSVKTGGEQLIPFVEIVNTTLASFAAIESIKEGKWIKLDTDFQ
jgi:predicted dehydrogenase